MHLHIADHPLVTHKVTKIREKDTTTKEFRELVDEISTFLCYEATRDAKTKQVNIETPVQATTGSVIANKYTVIPILRAGLGMSDGVLRCFPTANTGYIGLARDPETLLPIEYYKNLPPDVANREVILVDPMVATGHSVGAAIDIIKASGVKSIKLLCLVSCPEGVAFLAEKHPDVKIYTAAHDSGLNEKGYIVPGLGDAGDRLYGTQH